MGQYLDIVCGIPRTGSQLTSRSTNLENLTKPDTDNVHRLSEAGWKPKVSYRQRVIWERPDTGFYYSEEGAICQLERSAD